MTAPAPRPARGGATADQRLRATATRAALIASARACFTAAGYHATATTDLVVRAAVTRGALYHHFAGKEQLFEAAFNEVLAELHSTARAGVNALSGDTWAQVTGADTAYLRLIAASTEYQRILLIDGPAVLGWRRWRDLHAAYTAAGTADSLRLLMQQGLVADHSPEPLAYLIQAALNDAALSIAHAPDPQAASIGAVRAFLFLLEGLRLRPAAPPAWIGIG